jgi:hypothetical protein
LITFIDLNLNFGLKLPNPFKKFIFSPAKFLFTLRKFWKTFSEGFFKGNKVPHLPKIKKNLVVKRNYMKKFQKTFPEIFLHKKRKLGGGKRNHPRLI